MIPYAKPLALGTGIAAGLAAVLSEPPRILDPGATVAPQADLSPSGNTENMNTNIHPESNISGEPTAPARIPQPPARLAPPASPGYRVNVRGMTGNPLNYDSLASQVRQAAGGRARVNSTVRDRRSTLNPQKIAKILAGER
jgi:hypothetical protein